MTDWYFQPCYSTRLKHDLIVFFFRGADVNKNANSDDIEMKANLVDNKGDPNYVEETGPWNVLKILCMRYTLPKYLKILS